MLAFAVGCMLIIASPVLGGCSRSATPRQTAAPPLSFVIQISDNRFTPSSLTVPHGTSVTWDWSGKNEHSVVGRFGSQEVSSPKHRGSGTLTLTVSDVGTWHYECGVHGAAMQGTITVN